ncbi:hypothetical protein Nepgr_033542 [Nepenthes gracilis]|uniref:Uncharacterized protein n=1 Tax=Nepenthes gracilis TaxID=150966 RepID=A0AAD3TKT5_NEPGR|nr:hypothetical protein Nepgr_033542 [Nepenthes gracilis]
MENIRPAAEVPQIRATAARKVFQQLQQGFATSVPANTTVLGKLQLASSIMQLNSFTAHYQQASKQTSEKPTSEKPPKRPWV